MRPNREKREEVVKAFVRELLGISFELSPEAREAHAFKSLEDLEAILLNTLPSTHQIGDLVDITFFEAGALTSCRVYHVGFDDDKVFYGIEVMTDAANRYVTRLPRVDSAFVTAAQQKG